jgi:hypothetical protein
MLGPRRRNGIRLAAYLSRSLDDERLGDCLVIEEARSALKPVPKSELRCIPMQTARGVLPAKQIWLDLGQSDTCENWKVAKCNWSALQQCSIIHPRRQSRIDLLFLALRPLHRSHPLGTALHIVSDNLPR